MVKEAVSEAITHHLSDPRIESFVSVTRVEMSPDLRNANVFLSIFGKDEVSQSKTFTAIAHAKNRIQSMVAGSLKSKFSPVLHIYRDEAFKKTLETLNLIDKAVSELKEENSEEDLNKEEI